MLMVNEIVYRMDIIQVGWEPSFIKVISFCT